nr:hypothetical protein Iba_chr03cCG13210 [Ipomoea batatas]GMC76751.1 hypothetical protein Iba_chr03eCG4160 [Ipomoea batatas]
MHGPPTTIKRQVYSGPESEYDEEKNDDQSPQEHSFVCCVSVSDIYSALVVSSKDLRLLITSSSGFSVLFFPRTGSLIHRRGDREAPGPPGPAANVHDHNHH